MTEAMRRARANYKARQRRGLAVFRITALEFETVNALIESGRLTAGDALDRREVERAVAEVVFEWTARWNAE